VKLGDATRQQQMLDWAEEHLPVRKQPVTGFLGMGR
jgi:hypothetical protein